MKPLDRFVQVETGLRRSKLVDRLMADIGFTEAEAVGHLVLLWSAALDARTCGDLSERSDRWIEDAACYHGSPGAFAAAIRKYHCDDRGVIRDFEAKYGKLDAARSKATGWKRQQRERAKLSSESPVDRGEGVESLSTGQTEDSPAFSSIYQSVSPDLALEQGKGEREREGDGDDPTRREHRDALCLIADRFGEHAKYPLGLVRSARNPAACAGVLLAHLDGMHGPVYEPAVVALAAQEYAASDHAGFNPRLFAGFVRRAEGTVKLTASRRQQQSETRYIRGEAEERDRVASEEAERDRALAHFQQAEPARFAELREIAERAVKLKGALREPFVLAELYTLIRSETRINVPL